jgi:hypothetical protein
VATVVTLDMDPRRQGYVALQSDQPQPNGLDELDGVTHEELDELINNALCKVCVATVNGDVCARDV